MTFPVQNVLAIWGLRAGRAGGGADGHGSIQGVWWAELGIRTLRLSTYVALAALYAATFDVAWAKTWQWNWVLYLWARNMAVMGTFYGGWHHFLYEDEANLKAMHGKKFNPAFPSQRQHRRDRFWTSVGFTISTGFEAVMLHLYATGSLETYRLLDRPLYTVACLIAIGYWRDFHFYWTHRLMHPWPESFVPNIGRLLYTHVHSLHHKSYNTGPWSGLAMHPIEHLCYYSCTLLSFGVVQHPLVFWMNKLHADISPLPGHDGFDKPAGGSHFHYLHHAHYNCNYGTPMMPFDYLFGTYEDGSKWEKAGIRPGVNELETPKAD